MEDDLIDLHSGPACSAASASRVAVQDRRPLSPHLAPYHHSYPVGATTKMPTGPSGITSCHEASITDTIVGLENMLGQKRQQICLPIHPFLQGWTEANRKSTDNQLRPLERRGLAYLILSHEGELEEGVIDSVRVQMAESASGRHDIIFELQGSPKRPFLRIDAPSEALAARCLEEARTCADNIIYDQSVKLESLLLEPIQYLTDPARVAIRNGRLQLIPDLISSTGGVDSTPRTSHSGENMCRHLATALKKAGRIQDRINLRIHFGRFHFNSVPQQPIAGPSEQTYIGLDQLTKTLRQGRTKGEFGMQLGDQDEALGVLRALKKNSCLFLPHEMAVDTKDVPPQFHFEAQSRKWKIDADINSIDTLTPRQHPKGDAFEVVGIRATECAESSPGSQLGFQILSADTRFDWKIETIPDMLVKQAGFDTLKSEIRAASIQLEKGSETSDQDFPRLRFGSHSQRARELCRVVIKSVFRFRYGPAPYNIDFTIKREWPTIQAMANNQIKPTTTFSIIIYGEHWGETRASDVAKTGQGWGSELEHLFGDCRDSTHNDDVDSYMTGEARVQNLVNIVHDIRCALSA